MEHETKGHVGRHHGLRREHRGRAVLEDNGEHRKGGTASLVREHPRIDAFRIGVGCEDGGAARHLACCVGHDTVNDAPESARVTACVV